MFKNKTAPPPTPPTPLFVPYLVMRVDNRRIVRTERHYEIEELSTDALGATTWKRVNAISVNYSEYDPMVSVDCARSILRMIDSIARGTFSIVQTTKETVTK